MFALYLWWSSLCCHCYPRHAVWEWLLIFSLASACLNKVPGTSWTQIARLFPLQWLLAQSWTNNVLWHFRLMMGHLPGVPLSLVFGTTHLAECVQVSLTNPNSVRNILSSYHCFSIISYSITKLHHKLFFLKTCILPADTLSLWDQASLVNYCIGFWRHSKTSTLIN